MDSFYFRLFHSVVLLSAVLRDKLTVIRMAKNVLHCMEIQNSAHVLKAEWIALSRNVALILTWLCSYSYNYLFTS
jgi:hypothetical protein